MLRNLRHAGCAARMKIGGDTIFSCILKIKYAVLLCRFWEPAQGDQDLRIGLAQDCGNLVRFQQRVDGIGNARNAAPHKGQGRLATDRQKIGHDIIFPNTQAAE